MAVVENLLVRLELSRMAVVRVFNKVGLVSVEYAWTQSAFYQAIPVYANKKRLWGNCSALLKKWPVLIRIV